VNNPAPTSAASAPATRSGTGTSIIHFNGLKAVWRRELSSLLGNPLGYFFILAFVLATAIWLFWFRGNQFFARNISDLGLLVDAMPWFLAVLLPALAMGSWAREREQGTEELLLTLPLSVSDALIGKFFAVGSYFTIALACSLSNVLALAWLGSPDLGLVFANYLGWWLAGLSFAAVGIFASVLVTVPAIAFVVGAMLCALIAGTAYWSQWFDDFNRGVVPLFNVVVSLGIIVAFLGAATLLLSSRRWRPGSASTVWAQVLTLTFAIILAVNLAHWANRKGAFKDVSVEGLSSLSPDSDKLLQSLEQPVTITAFISENLPPQIQLKAEEVEYKLKAVARTSGRVTVKINHPVDALDDAGQAASREFGLKSRKVPVEEVSGREPEDVFLGAAVTCGGNTQVIEYFDPGLSVEYELIRAVRSVALSKKHVLGLAQTDLQMTSGFDFQSGGMTPEWEIVKEWKKQYEVRPVNLDSAVAPEIEVLVVPQPSSLTQPQIEHLHDYIWNGRPTLLLEDPLPVVEAGKPELIPSRPKKSSNPYGGGGEDQNTPKKGDLKPLWGALGIDYDENTVIASDYNPMHAFKGLIPNTFLVVNRTDTKSETDSPAVAGIDSLLFLFAGELKVSPDKYSALTVTPLVRVTPHYPWTRVPMTDIVHFDYMGHMDIEQQSVPVPDFNESEKTPIIAAEITGRMPSAYPELDPGVKVDPSAAAQPEKKVGIPSAKPVHVIVVSDTDCFSEMFFRLYRNENSQFSTDDTRMLTEMRNVQFAGNAVDALFSDDKFAALRTRRPVSRPLVRLETMLAESQKKKEHDVEEARTDAKTQIDRLRSDNENSVQAIKDDANLDDNAKQQAIERVTVMNQRKLEIAMNDINLTADKKMSEAKSTERRDIRVARSYVQVVAIVTPAVLLLLLALGVFIKRLSSESSHIPESRKRATV
jgi:ABC-2 type transport system permease protein